MSFVSSRYPSRNLQKGLRALVKSCKCQWLGRRSWKLAKQGLNIHRARANGRFRAASR